MDLLKENDMKREELEELLVDNWVEQMDLGALVDFFREHQFDYVSDLSEEELIQLGIDDGFLEEDESLED